MAGRFEVLDLAGEGGMGAVYRARDRLSGALVAVKVLRHRDGPGEQRLVREAQVLSDLAHPGIVGHVAHGATPDGTLYLAMEWLEGVTLADRLRSGPLSPPEAIHVAWHVADALDAAHRRGIVHRDVKPSNVMLLSGPPRIKVLDFGIAHLRPGDQKLTATGALLGTPGYMSPEQARGEVGIDSSTDVFSLGCVLYECLSGQRAFEAEDVMMVLLKLVMEEPPRLRDALPASDPLLDDIVSRMLAKDPAQRPRDGDAVKRALAALQRSTEPAAAPPPAPLSVDERRWMSAALIRPGAPPPAQAWEALAGAVARHGGRLDQLADGSAVVVVSLAGLGARAPDAATDLAARAARCALHARETLPGSSVALVTGRSDRRGDVGEVLRRGVALLHGAEVRVDDATRRLLGARFQVGQTGVLERERDEDEGGPAPLLASVPFVGRGREIALLEGLFEECESAPMAQAAIVVGPAGIGKSRLRRELQARLAARARPPSVWAARGDALSAGSPFGMLARALRREAGIVDGEPVEAHRSKLCARFQGRLPPGARARALPFLGELCDVPFPDSAGVELRAARANPMLMGDHIRRAFEDLVEAECSLCPLVLVLDDLHWGDRPSVDLLDGVLRNLHDAPLLVIALGRLELGSVFPDLWSDRRAQTVRLGELMAKHGEELVRSALGDRIDGAALSRIVERASGNAFFLEELVRSFAEGRGEEMPESVLAMVGARIERLDPLARRLLLAGSLFGGTFWTDGVRALLGEGASPADVQSAIHICIQRELLVRRRTSRLAGQEEIAFRHALVRDAAAAMVAEEAVAAGHVRVAEWLERAGEHDPVVLAEHFERGGSPARAAEAFRRAATLALEGNDLDAVIRLADRGLACAPSGPVAGELWALEAEAHSWRGRYTDCERCALAALPLLPDGSTARWRTLSLACDSAAKLNHRDVAERFLREILEPARPAEGAMAWVDAVARVSFVVLLYFGEGRLLDAALARLDEVERLPALMDPVVQAGISRARASLLNRRGGFSLPHLRESIRRFEEAGDLRRAAAGQTNLGFALVQFGAYEEARDCLVRALSATERLGLRNPAATAKHNLGLVLALVGDPASGRALEQEAIESFRAQNDARLTGASQAYLACILALEGDLSGAEQEARAALATLGDAVPAVRAFALGALAEVRLRRGDPAGALAAADMAAELAGALGGSIEEGDARFRLARAEALAALGRGEEARLAIAAARSRLLVRAAAIPEGRYRESFLHAVAENARTLALADAWGAGAAAVSSGA